MGFAQTFSEMLAKLVGPDGRDDIQQLEADIATDNSVLKDCEQKRAWLRSQLTAAELDDDVETAEQIDDELRRLDRLERGAQGRLPILEQRRKAALDIKRGEAIAVAKQQNLAAYLKVKSVVAALAAANAEAIALGERLRGEFGEATAAVHFPRVAFVGIALPDLAQLWLQDMDRQMGLSHQAASPQPKPIAAPSAPKQRAIPTVSNANRPVSLNDATVMPPRSPRPAAPAPVEGGTKIRILRSGVEISGYQASIGDEVVVERSVADKLMNSGAADRIQEAAHAA